MEEIIILGSKNYEDQEKNYGDCIIINTGNDLFIYDCGSEEHANRVIDYMRDNNFRQATIVLSHNDSDHFNGIPVLVENGCVSEIYTNLLLKYAREIYARIGDKRKTLDSIKRDILEEYDNIASLSGCNLTDIYPIEIELSNEIRIVGPELNYMLDTVSKNLDDREGNTVDMETAKNATSIQLSVDILGHNLLLCGDCSFAAIENVLQDYDIIQLPHHGKNEQAESIFEINSNQLDTIYIVSDNTGSSNGGSDDLQTVGHIIHNTNKENDIVINKNFFVNNNSFTGSTLG